jgi:plastocyanin
MAPTRTFEHTFTQPGQYPYFCILHPSMVGIVRVLG